MLYLQQSKALVRVLILWYKNIITRTTLICMCWEYHTLKRLTRFFFSLLFLNLLYLYRISQDVKILLVLMITIKWIIQHYGLIRFRGPEPLKRAEQNERINRRHFVVVQGNGVLFCVNVSRFVPAVCVPVRVLVPGCFMPGCWVGTPDRVWHRTAPRAAARTGRAAWSGTDAPPAHHASLAHQQCSGDRTPPLLL